MSPDPKDGRGSIEGRERLVKFEPSALRSVQLRELGLRFAFGAAISVVAGVVSLVWGPRAGGMFLAFPAILPAAATLIERKEDVSQARDDVAGALPGSIALAAFAVVGGVTLSRWTIGSSLTVALVAWCAVAVMLYALWAVAGRRTAGDTSAGRGPTRSDLDGASGREVDDDE